MPSSRLPGFFKRSPAERLELVQQFAGLSDDEMAVLRGADPVRLRACDRMIENVVGLFHLPLGFATNFLIDGVDVLVPMVIEEPSVVAAASNAAKLLRAAGGIHTQATPPEMIGQIQLLDVPDPDAAAASLEAEAEALVAIANTSQPRLVARGGGARSFEVRRLADPVGGRTQLVAHLVVDVRDAMGANLVNQMAEVLAPRVEELSGGRVGLKILSNLSDRRRVVARGRVAASVLARPDLGLDGARVARRLQAASAFAEADPYRAATHNKGIMNGVDAFLLATGQDWRAVEAGAHAYAARSGRYRALATWAFDEEAQELHGEIDLPLQVGTVGGITRVHEVVRVLLKIVGVERAADLARVAAAVGLAQNLAAIVALATEGIQRGHMSLHARNIAAVAGARPDQVDAVVAEMIRRREFTAEAASDILGSTASSRPALTLERFAEARQARWPLVEAIIDQVLPREGAASGSVEAMAWYQLGLGGKRVRATVPFLVHEALDAGEPEVIAPFAAAMELLHGGTLVHHSLAAGVRTRHGKPTVWARYGRDQAVSAGDGLLFAALRCLDLLPHDAGRVRTLVSRIVRHMTQVVHAQVDAVLLQGERRGAFEERLSLERERTGGLLALAVIGPAHLAGVVPSQLERLDRIGGELGVLLMLQEDLLDLLGDGARDPSTASSSLGAGHAGLVVAHALDHASGRLANELHGLLGAPGRGQRTDVQRVIAILREVGSIDHVADRIVAQRSAVHDQLGALDAPVAKVLEGFADILLAPLRTALAELSST